MSAALEVRAVRKSFGRTRVLDGVDLTVNAGERHAIIGPNGAGKSTLFDIVSGRLRADGGSVLLDGRDIASRAPFEICRLGLARSFQITNLFARLSALDALRCASLAALGGGWRIDRRIERIAVVEEHARAILARIGLAKRAGVLCETLSYAEQRALEIGIVLATRPRILLLDEPTAGMSRSEAADAVALVRASSAGCTLLLVEHDMGVVYDLADRVSVLVDGRVIASAPPADIRADPRVRAAYLGTAADA